MARHLQREIENLKKRILALGAQVEQRVRDSIRALEDRNADLARQIIEKDTEIDVVEVEIEEECLKILALHQPVAIDLRFIISVLKINNDLERIGDLAVNIAERASFLAHQPEVQVHLNFSGMAQITHTMLKQSLDALVHLNAKLAHQVCLADNQVDDLHRDMYVKIQNAIRANPRQIESLIQLLSASRHLERIADHATNVAEDVIYMIAGEIVRHNPEKFRDPPKNHKPPQ